jgi:heme-degrading monooxygenase HmoA
MVTLRPLDPLFPIERQIGLETGPIVLVNVITVDKQDEPALLKALEAEIPIMKSAPGYISAQLHRAVGDSPKPTYLNYAVWESMAHFRAAFTNPKFRGSLANFPSSIVASPHVFQKIALPNACVA